MCCQFSRSQLSKLALFLSLTLGPLSAQFQTFDLDPALSGNYKHETNIFARGTALGLGHHQLFTFNTEQRFRLGICLARPIALESNSYTDEQFGLIPLINTGYLVTSNLLLTGKISGYKTGRDIVQILAGGAALMLGEVENENRPRIDLNLATLRGPADFRIRQTDILLQRHYRVLRLPFQVGAGVNLYWAKAEPDGAVSARHWEGQTNYLYLSSVLHTKFVDAGIHARWHPTLFTFSIDFVQSVF